MALDSQPFTLSVPDADLADLRDRLARTRLPDQAPGAAWAYGTDVAYLTDLIAYWRDGFDWRRQEAALNAFPQRTTELHGIRLHYLHVPGKGPNPLPLLLMHGWPGSVFEFLDIIPRLTDPAAFGGDPADAFTVVAPSLPGYGLSFRPGQARFSVPDMADCFADLMTGLGYTRFAVQGGDWGAHTASSLGIRHPDKLVGIHLNMLSLAPDQPPPAEPTAAEQRYLDQIAHWLKEESGYTAIQGTKPQTLAFAMNDSPAGLAAWIVEKFHGWTDNDGTPDSAISRDHMLADISLYWFTGSVGASFWPYYARMHGHLPIPEGMTIDVPTGYAEFPKEIRRPPRSIAEKTYVDIRRWTSMTKGGHFAALEQPEALAAEVAAFYRPLR